MYWWDSWASVKPSTSQSCKTINRQQSHVFKYLSIALTSSSLITPSVFHSVLFCVVFQDCVSTDVVQNPSFTKFRFQMFQISSKSDNNWPSYARFCEIQDGGGGHIGCWAEPPLSPLFSKVYITSANFQISSKSNNKWPNYTRFCEIQDGGGGHLGFV